jgi:uncharacterized protein (TIGR03435 family)
VIAARLVVLAASPLIAQTVAPHFEVTSVRVNRSGSNAVGGNVGVPSNGHVSITNITLRELIRTAYDVQDFQIVGGPDWLSHERYDIKAQAPAPVSYADGQLMLQSLLTDRFNLQLHRGRKTVQGYTLRVAKGPARLVRSTGTSATGFRIMNRREMHGPAIDMPMLARTLTHVLNAPVEDRTMIEGLYSISLKWLPDDLIAQGEAGVSLFTALREQLGLELKAAKISAEALFIDTASKIPTAN